MGVRVMFASTVLLPLFSLGCEGNDVVVGLGHDVTQSRVGDGVFGCTRVGQREYATFQERFLMDEDCAFRRPDSLSAEEASTLGVALDTAALGLLAGLGIALPEPGTKAVEKDEWIVILGGNGSVGAVAVQLARLAGYKVLASSSPAKSSIALHHGATATLDHNLSLPDQLTTIKETTGGNFSRVFDARARAHGTAVEALSQASTTSSPKLYSTVNTWTPFTTPAGIRQYRCKLGEMGQDTTRGREVTAWIADWIPDLEGHLANGEIRPLQYQVVEGRGWEAVIRASEIFESGAFERKLVDRTQDE